MVSKNLDRQRWRILTTETLRLYRLPKSMEHEFHNWLRSNTPPQSAQIKIGIGDDAAMLAGSNETLVVTTDTIAEGTHFELDRQGLDLVGRKALAVNLSDIAAMGACPTSAVLTFLLPRSFELPQAQQLFAGMRELADEFEVAIIGGDTNSWDGPLVVGATVLGKRPNDLGGWLLNAAVEGDFVVVTGEFGGSIHGRHLSFIPRIEVAARLASNYIVHGATDVSDSLSLDLHAIGKSSGVGFDLDVDAIPVSSDVQTNDPGQRLQHALCDGEDFELILTMPPDEFQRLQSNDLPCQMTAIGKVTGSHQKMRTKLPDGTWKTIEPMGYVH